MNLQDFLSTRLFSIGDLLITVGALLLILLTGVVTFLVARLLDRLLHRWFEDRFGEETTGGLGLALQLSIWLLGIVVGSLLLGVEMRQLAEAASFEMFNIGDEPITPRSIAVLVLALIATGYAARLAASLGKSRFFRNVDTGPRYTIIRLIQYSIWVIGVIISLHIININLTALAVVAGALGLGIGFGLQAVVANFVAGLVLLFERPIRISDFVSSENIEGRVEEIRFRSTLIQTNDNISFIVPNSELTTRALVNWSHNDTIVRIHCPVGVAYGSDVELVTETLLEVAQEDEWVLKDPEPIVWFTSFGDSSLNFELLVWTNDPIGYRRLRSRINYSIDRAFRRAGVQIPFPQRDLHVRSAEGLHNLVRMPKTDGGNG